LRYLQAILVVGELKDVNREIKQKKHRAIKKEREKRDRFIAWTGLSCL